MAGTGIPRDRMAVLTDLFADEALGGWAVPREKMAEFISSVDAAARQVGAMRFTDVDFIDFDGAITSFMAMRFQLEKRHAIEEAEAIIAMRPKEGGFPRERDTRE